MCLAIPSKITKIEDGMATIDVDGVQRKTSLLLVEDASVGDYVIVHAGFALHKIDEAAAMESLRILKEAAAFAESQDDDSPDSSSHAFRAFLNRGQKDPRPGDCPGRGLSAVCLSTGKIFESCGPGLQYILRCQHPAGGLPVKN